MAAFSIFSPINLSPLLSTCTV
uniref:Uncharacterized protein n=1 Tax=Rhizophora mucronata TaxID=61149 RepID=A0A2P2NUQ9_RHIMU